MDDLRKINLELRKALNLLYPLARLYTQGDQRWNPEIVNLIYRSATGDVHLTLD